jgi:GNAT superfamily N-acetyltransferase
MREMGDNVVDDWSSLLLDQPEGYNRYFHPFEFDRQTLRSILRNRKQDIYTGIYHGMRLIGFWMLRGWDEGYTMPTQGLMIDHRYSGLGIGTLCLAAMRVAARLRGAEKIMTRVHQGNDAAYNLSIAGGFLPVRLENNMWIMYCNLRKHHAEKH